MFIHTSHPVIKKRKLCADEEPTLLSDWVPRNDWVSTHDDMDFNEDEDYSQFEMKGWQQYAPDFAMDASGELREEVGPWTGKRKRYDSSVCPPGF